MLHAQYGQHSAHTEQCLAVQSSIGESWYTEQGIA